PELFLDPRTPAHLEATGRTELGAQLEHRWVDAVDARRAAAEAWRAAPEAPGSAAHYRETQAAVDAVTAEAAALEVGDLTNPLFLDFLLRALPAGLLGLVLAAVCAAAMSSMDSE